MGLNGLIIKSGASAMTPTGGADETFSSDGISIPNGLHTIDASVADFRIRPSVTWKYRPPTLQTDGSYTKGKWTASFTQPQLLASGKTVFNVIRIEAELHPELAAATALDYRLRAAQLISDSDAASFWATGSMA